MTQNERPADDVLLDDAQVMALCCIGTKMGLHRWRLKHDFPAPSLYVGQRGFTWRSVVMAWLESRPTTSPIAGRQIPRKPRSQSDQHDAAA